MKSFVAFFAAALLASSAHAAAVTANASADVVTPLILSNPVPLSFGTFAAGSSAGTVFSDGDASPSIQVLSPGTAASFHVTGQDGDTYSVIGAPQVTLDDPGAGAPMIATLTYPSGGTLDGGEDDFAVSGALAVGANQTPGHYTGTYDVSVNY